MDRIKCILTRRLINFTSSLPENREENNVAIKMSGGKQKVQGKRSELKVPKLNLVEWQYLRVLENVYIAIPFQGIAEITIIYASCNFN